MAIYSAGDDNNNSRGSHNKTEANEVKKSKKQFDRLCSRATVMPFVIESAKTHEERNQFSLGDFFFFSFLLSSVDAAATAAMNE